jgi:hypothetical protein
MVANINKKATDWSLTRKYFAFANIMSTDTITKILHYIWVSGNFSITKIAKVQSGNDDRIVMCFIPTP